MNSIRRLLKDRKASQRGSVLSGVLFMTAFIAIISGALMTELSTHFVLSHNLMTRLSNQATVNSAIEASLGQLQATQLNSGCPALQPVNLNNSWALPSYESCWPTIDVRSPQYTVVASSSGAFNIDGTHPQLSGLNDYVVGNAAGTVFDYSFGSSTPRWTLPFPGGNVTAPPLVTPNPGSLGQFQVVIPLSGSPCPAPGYCLSVRSGDWSRGAPGQQCSPIPAAGGVVVAQPAASPGVPGVVYHGTGQILEANDVSGTDCDFLSRVTVPGGQPVVSGPLAFRCVSGCGGTADEVYAIVSDAWSSRIVRYTYGSNTLALAQSLQLPWAKAAGIATSGPGLPATMAITFKEGGVALVRIDSSGGMTLARSAQLSSNIAAAPYWCVPCSLIGIGGRDGRLYLFDPSLNPIATYTGGGSAISTTPGADGAGTWYFATDDGLVHEAQVQPGNVMAQVNTYNLGPTSRAGSSVQVGGCPVGICVYLGALNNNLYLLPLNARDAVISACISNSAAPPCSGANPRLRAQVEVGTAGNPNTVHIQGWAYYTG